jgi:type I restriction enzyme S subunit
MGIALDKFKVEKYSSYKDSGVEWIGEIPKYWKSERLTSILNSVSERSGTDLPLLSITREKGVIIRDLDNEEENHNFIPDDLSNYKVIRKGQFGMNKMKAWQGSYGISDQDGIVSPAYFIFQLRNDIDSRYFHLAIRSRLYVSFFGSASDGVRIGQWDLSRDRMKNIPFLIPPLLEQTAIAEFLDRKTKLIDQAIGIKQKQIELLKERRQILIHKAVTRGLNPNVKMKDSGVEWIGEIPEGWTVTSVKHVLEMPICDGPHTTPQLYEEGYPFVSAEAIKNGEVDFDKIRGLISLKDYLQFSKKYSPKRNDIYMVKSGATTGNVAMVRTDIEFSIWSPLAVFRANQKKVIPNYLLNYLESPSFRLGVELSWSFGTQQNIGMGILSNLPIAYPSLDEQILISEYISRVTDKVKSAISLKDQEIEKLKEYKATLINSAVTGKIKVYNDAK